MGVRVAVIITLSTLFSYLHIRHTLRVEALARLEQHVSERSQREQALFVLAEDNHAVLKKALEEKLRAFQTEDVSARFNNLFVRMPDGSVRNRPELFDGMRMAGLFVPRGVTVDLDMRRRLLAAYDVLNQYGPAFHTRFEDTFIILPEGPILIYWPECPTWTQDAAPDFLPIQMNYFRISLPENNPQRQTAWTNIYKSDISERWMASATTPLYMDGSHVASVGQDVFIEDLMTRTLNEHLPGAYNVIFRDDGELIAHPALKLDDVASQPDAMEQTEHLRSIIERVRTRPATETVVELPDSSEYLAVARLQGPGWNFVTVLPESVMTQPALLAARYVMLLGVLSLLLELGIMYWVLQQQITRPLLTFTQATDRVAAGDFKVELDTSRGDELGQLARAFRLMADQVQRREEELRQANEGLELRVEERTRELKDVHAQLVKTARQAGMAEIATNVLHNVGNVLNSVYTSAQVAKERMTGMRLEHVGRVAHMLQERQGDLNTFLTQDERGRHLMPFLDKLGQNLVDERQEVVALLDDVGRYTEHIGDIVKVQQNYARTPRLHEPVQLAELVEDAIRINSAGLTRHQVTVVRQLASLPPVLTDKHKLLMILVNLVSNAKYAMDDVPPAERLLTVKLEHSTTDSIRIEIHDNGMGIAPELLTRIFTYGFTTREEGHGFGLHSSALAAQELGGSLTVHSAGKGQGATFTLEIPYQPAQAAK
ncbi:HAMP domain-containing protein [Archangium minus]|uniref:histidine kinase n=2 Tax=Archangium minus TaxID=83450 RepID=A0ABY9XCG4_9BACT|nr:HAMP domain-containing protein [Archangium minus]